MAKPIKLRKSEASTDLYECQCGQSQTDELTRCPKCQRFLCDVCMSFGTGVPCIDCDSGMDEVDF